MSASHKYSRRKGSHDRAERPNHLETGGKSDRGSLSGPLHIARNGFGFIVDPKTDEAVWISPNRLGTALPGDVVSVKVCPAHHGRRMQDASQSTRRDGPVGQRLQIVERVPHRIAGTITGIMRRRCIVRPLNPAMRREFMAPVVSGARKGDRVLLEFSRWDDPAAMPEGTIAAVIGPAGDPSLDTAAVMAQYDLPENFPEDVLECAAAAASRLNDSHGRLDLRKKFIFTCDPETARDFDDALSIELDEHGNRILGVHIADVSHFVRPGTPLDREAYRRSTSVYLVDRVIPMLPETLSNGVCSLVPGEDRLAFSAFLTFDAAGRCTARKFAKSVIRSKARFTYAQVAEMLDGTDARRNRKPGKKATLARAAVNAISELAQTLRARRFAEGALDIEVPETEIILDADGGMKDVVRRISDKAHQMVEECMVAANEAVAKHLWTKGVRIVTRLHEPPDGDKLEDLRASLAAIGVRCGDISRPAAMAEFLARIKKHPLADAIGTLVLRSMKCAVYAADRIGHFGLAKTHYAHFTSPIRRYPDLTLHRQLADLLSGGTSAARRNPAMLAGVAKHASERERAADEAANMLATIKKFRFLADQLDAPRTYDAVVTRCTRLGAFVDLPELAVGGMVHISRLSRAHARFDASSGTIRAGGRSLGLGDRLRVQIVRVDEDAQRLDFAAVDEEGTARR